MATEAEGPSLDRALRHPLRKRLIAALWHSSEPLTARQIGDEYLDEDRSDMATIAYHLRVLEREGVVRAADPPAGPDAELASPARGVVLGGENAGEAVRRLGFADGRDP
jgi:DNA-binding transcriptional ArsR family regulator